MRIKHYYFNLTVWQLVFLILLITIPFATFAQQQILNSEETTISAGAEYSQYLQKMINSGQADQLKYSGIPQKLNKPEGISAITTIEGINFDEDGTNNGGFVHIPPDPSGAAGPNHLVSVVNTSIEWFTKAGVQENSQSLASFFSSEGPLTATFDPKVIYDQFNDKFVVVTLEKTDVAQGDPSNTSRIFIAVSQSSDPNSGWYFEQIDSKINISGSDTWADYPGFAVGTDAIYITLNMFTFGTNSNLGARLWIIAKTPFYSGGAALVSVYDHVTLAGGFGITYQPAHMFGTPQGSTGTFLIGYSGLTTGVDEGLSIIRVDNPLGSISFNHQTPLVGNIDNTTSIPFPDAPQLGAVKGINTNDRRTLNAVWRNNSLWVTTTVIPPLGTNAGQVTAHWFRFDTGTLSSISLADQGDIGGETIATGCYTFFPSVAVNSSGDAVIGFSASASTIYPGCYYTGRVSTDPAGTTITPDTVKAGVDYYVRTFTSGSVGRNRWGDYTGSSVDPSDDQTFYVFNEYAITRGTIILGEDGRWGTTFGVIPAGLLPVELSSFTANVLRSGGIKLDWRTETEVDNYGFEIERLQDYNIEKLQDWGKIGFVGGNGNSNSPKEYSYTDEGIDYGSYAYRLKQIDTDGDFEYSKIIEVDAGNIPDGFVLEQNYPNPFNPSTTIKFALAETQKAELKVFDILGNEVATLFNGIADGGKVYEAVFNAVSLSSGIYFYRLATDNKVENRKMLLIK